VNTNEPRVAPEQVTLTAAALRKLFDESFAAAAASTTERLENLIAIRVGADPYALRLSEIAGLHAGRKIVSVPSPVAQLLGIVGLRGMMLPVYDLAALLRYPSAPSPRWMVVTGGSQPVGFAFETFEVHVQVPEESAANGEDEGPGNATSRPHLRGAVRAAGALRPIIHMASLVEIIRNDNS
jgi:chemotaxis signal transduction protein